MKTVTIVGGGLAGSEAAWQAAARGVSVVLHEMRRDLPSGSEAVGPKKEPALKQRSGRAEKETHDHR